MRSKSTIHTHTEAAFTQQRFFMNTVTLVFVFTEEMQCLHEVLLSAEVNYAHGMWVCCFWQALGSSARCTVENATSCFDRRRSRAFANLSCEYEG